jgi:NAD+ kinase
VSRPHVCVVLKRTSWRKWVEEEKDARVAALIDAKDETVRRMRPAHGEHMETVDEVRRVLDDLHAVATWHDRALGFRAEDRCDLVVTVGGDGTLLAASHGIGPGIPLLGVNSAPNHSVGFFCAGRKGSVRDAIGAALEGVLRRSELTRMRVEHNGRVLHQRVLNEALFCHLSPAATSRYILRRIEALSPYSPRSRKIAAERVIAQEEQKSSGLWIGPAAGSTAAQRSAGGRVMPLSSCRLQYVVREPYRPRVGSLRMTLGLVREGEALTIKSQMRDARVFLDGDNIVHEVGIGDVVTMRRSDEPLIVLGLPIRGGRRSVSTA